jgi:hypothetical protein
MRANDRRGTQMTGHGEKFIRKKELAIAALLTCPTLPAAAASCGISESTLRRWLQNETFSRRYRRERTRVLETAVNLLRQKSLASVETLASMAESKESPANVRVTAARAVIELAIKGAEMQDLEARIDDLEQMAKEKL